MACHTREKQEPNPETPTNTGRKNRPKKKKTETPAEKTAAEKTPALSEKKKNNGKKRGREISGGRFLRFALCRNCWVPVAKARAPVTSRSPGAKRTGPRAEAAEAAEAKNAAAEGTKPKMGAGLDGGSDPFARKNNIYVLQKATYDWETNPWVGLGSHFGW